jgi:hypothetical protein
MAGGLGGSLRGRAGIGGTRQEQPRAAESRTRLSFFEISYALTASDGLVVMSALEHDVHRRGRMR